VAAVRSVVDQGIWTAEFEAVTELISGRFARPAAARNAGDLVAGLVSDLERKNCWTIAERESSWDP
jgi:hypothetical protein